MKKILTILVLLVAVCNSSWAQTKYYTIVGDEALMDSNWSTSDTNNRMTLSSNNNRYYLVKEITTTGAVTYEFKAYYYYYYKKNWYSTATEISTYFSYDGWSGNATVEITEAGHYYLVFCIDDNNQDHSLDVVIVADVSEDYSGNNLWTRERMEFNTSDNKFHLTKEVDVTDYTSQTGEFKCLVSHRSMNNTTYYGTDGYGNGSNISVSFSGNGSYDVEFVLDPIFKTTPTYTVSDRYVKVTIPEGGWRTFSYPEALTIPSGVTGYYISELSGSSQVKAPNTSAVPATTTNNKKGSGVILQGAAGTYKFYPTTDVTLSGNQLYGTGTAEHSVANTGDAYVFANSTNGIGFYLANASNATTGMIGANKAYLNASDITSSAREFISINFGGDDVNAITLPESIAPARTGQYYNLQGQPVDNPTRGLYILNGRKVVVK